MIDNASFTAMYLNLGSVRLQKSLERLASGLRINRAGDDAAGLQISEALGAQIRGMQQAYDNVQDGSNVLDMVDGAYSTINGHLQRMRELAVQAGNDTYSAEQRAAMQSEIDQLSAEITRIADSTQFNGLSLMDGSQVSFIIQAGPDSSDTIDLASGGVFDDADAGVLLGGGVQVDTSANARTAIDTIDNAMNIVNSRRGAVGAMSNRLEGAANNLGVGMENRAASRSRIRDLDYAEESARMIQNQILLQAGISVQAQAMRSSGLLNRFL